LRIVNSVFDDLEIGGKTTAGPNQVWIELDNSHFRRFALIVYSSIKATNSTIPIFLSNTWQPFQADFTGCTFTHAVIDDGSNMVPRGVNIGMTPAAQVVRWSEVNCRHEIDGDLSGALGINKCIGISSPIVHADLSRFRIFLEGVYFDPRFPTSIDAYNAGDFFTNNCHFGGTVFGVDVGSSPTFAGRWTSSNDNFENVSGETVRLLGNVDSFSNLVRIDGGIWSSLDIRTVGAHANIITGDCRRRMQVGAAPTDGGIFGDEAILDPSAYAGAATNAPIRWRARLTHSSNAQWEAVETKA